MEEDYFAGPVAGEETEGPDGSQGLHADQQELHANVTLAGRVVKKGAGHRRCVLLNCALLRLSWAALGPGPRECVLAAEGLADEPGSRPLRGRLRYAIDCGLRRGRRDEHRGAWWVAPQSASLHQCVEGLWRETALCGDVSPCRMNRARDCVLGPEGGLPAPESAWLAPDARSLARAAYEQRLEDGSLDPLRLAVLADCLEEAGCPAVERCAECDGHGLRWGRTADGSALVCSRCSFGKAPGPLLGHLRSEGPHFRGCRALDLVLGKE